MKRIFNAIKYSLSGIYSSYKTEPAFRQEIIIFIVFGIVAIMLDIEILHKILLISSIIIILIAELINSAIEASIDRISTEIHPLAKKAKDAASAAVFLAFLNAISIWVIILIN